MNRCVPLIVVGAVGASLLTPVAASPATASDGSDLDVVVAVDDDTDAMEVIGDVVAGRGHIEAVYEHAVSGFAATLPEAVVDELRDDPRVRAIDLDHPIEASATPTGVRRIGADAYGPADIDGDGSRVDVDVAVLDTGVDAAHPDLHVAGGVDCLSGSCTALDIPSDVNGHGTHVAGTVAARDDGIGVVGVAPGARLHSVRVLEADGSGESSSLIAGLEWLRVNADRIEVANLSLGCKCSSTILNDAIRAVVEAGVTVVVAAGNQSSDAGSYSPANHPDVIAVAAMSDYDGAPGRRATSGCIADADDSFGSYSNYGAVVDFVAPGSCISSTWPGARYARSTGTSTAAPHVAGAAALHIATDQVPASGSRPAAVRQALLDRFSVASTDECGYTDSVSIAPMLHLTCEGTAVNADPQLEVSSPVDGVTVVSGQSVALRATARDAEDGALDDDIVWRSSVEGALGTGPSLDVTMTTVGDHVVTASVTDSSGANVRISRLVRVTTQSGTTGGYVGDPPAVPEESEPEAEPSTDNSPQLAIVAPVPGSRIVADREVQLVSRAVDVEDGDIRAWVTWRSDRDGDLGAGGTIGVELAAGDHRITAVVTDADDNLVERTTGVVVADPAQLGVRTIDDACPDDGEADSGFRDVAAGNPHAEAIDCIAAWGITSGTGDGGYAPAGTVSRGQMATFLVEMIQRSGGSLPEPTRDYFEDDDGTTHEANTNRLAAAGIIQGTSAGRYSPGAPVSREQMATFLVRTYERRSAFELPNIQQRFTDASGSAHATNIDAVAVAGIAGGVEPERYDPRSAVRRDQMASFLARTLDVLVDVGITAPRA